MYKHQGEGISLLEMLLVVGVIAVISLLCINHYQRMQQNALLVEVKSDKEIIGRSLNNYFYRAGCNQNGTFSKISAGATQFQPDIVNDLGLSATYEQRLPLVQSYSVFIIDTGQKTSVDSPPKPIYYLKIQAQLNVANTQMDWYQKQLSAEGYSGMTLYWRGLMDNSYFLPHKQLWVLDGSRQLFKRNETDPDSNSPSIAGSYCAN